MSELREMAFIPQSHKPVYDYDVLDVVLMSSGAGSGVFFSPKSADVDNTVRVLAYGPPKETITAELISRIYGVDVEVSSLYDDAVRVCVPAQELEKRK